MVNPAYDRFWVEKLKEVGLRELIPPSAFFSK